MARDLGGHAEDEIDDTRRHAGIVQAARITATDEPGVSSGHLMMIEQPAASAGAIFFSICETGKFHGAKPATGPTGSRITICRTPSARGRDQAAIGAAALVGEPVDDIGAGVDLHHRLGSRLALLLGQALGDVLGAGADEIGCFTQDLRPLDRC